jgi:hypothetical protein
VSVAFLVDPNLFMELAVCIARLVDIEGRIEAIGVERGLARDRRQQARRHARSFGNAIAAVLGGEPLFAVSLDGEPDAEALERVHLELASMAVWKAVEAGLLPESVAAPPTAAAKEEPS